ncbi:hypothetical protein [Halalkalicoccus subterraneus]|uniref:hypothetical protein n=1 Tax=Halalkalicoccus subterraneus TaxID=2675002 RepID=UPI000EFAE9BC|nr:hypothetical protein [Halalkalicoccus subterraneus]
MQTEPNERQERIDTTDRLTSPSAGWQEVYAVMGVSPSGDAENREPIPKRDEGRKRSSKANGRRETAPAESPVV